MLSGALSMAAAGSDSDSCGVVFAAMPPKKYAPESSSWVRRGRLKMRVLNSIVISSPICEVCRHSAVIRMAKALLSG